MQYGEKTIQLQELLGQSKEALEEVIKSFEGNATFKEGPDAKEYINFPIAKALLHAVASGQRYYLVGEAGIGKTSFAKWFCNVLGIKIVYLNAANISIENLQVPFPVEDPLTGLKVLDPLFYNEFVTPGKKIIFIDEIGRADQSLGNSLMEILQEGTLAGKLIPDLVTVIAADNPQGSDYGKMAGLDFSQADRFAALELTSKDTPWRRHLAMKFPNVDLNKVYSVYDTFDSDVRKILNPRVLEFLIPGLIEGFPGEYVLPIVNGIRTKLVNKAGVDITKPSLDKIASALGTVNRESIPDKLDRAVDYAVRTGSNLYIQGRPGIGKTSRIKALLKAKGISYHYDSAAVLQPEDMSVPFPSPDGKSIDLMPMRKFVDTEPWVWILDEIGRGSRRTQSSLMEPIQERTIAGKPLNLTCTIALNNPREVAGFKLDVGKNDLAQASRFSLSIEVDANDIPSPTYLRDLYGEEVATPFIEWWEDDLDDIGRVLCTPRCLERMISMHEADLPIQWALPYVNGSYVKVPLVELQARLDKRPMARLKAIVAKVDEYEVLLEAGKDENPMEHAAVFMAFYKADLKQLENAKDVCIKLYGVLDRQHKIDLIRQGGDRQRFWNSVLTDADKKNKK
jgi:MoxR-like ATPase